MTGPERQQDLRKLGMWHAALDPAARPSWDDVEIVARLGVTDAGVVRQLLLDDPSRLLSGWDDLQRLVHGPASGAGAARELTAPPATGATTPAPSVESTSAAQSSIVSESELEKTARQLGGVRGQRLQALLRWRSAHAELADLESVPDGAFVLLAKQGVADLRVFARAAALANYREELTALLTGRGDEAADAPQPSDSVALGVHGRQVQSVPTADEFVASAADTEDVAEDAAPASTQQTAIESSGSEGLSVATTYASTGFVPFSYEGPTHEEPPSSISVAANGDESLQLTWPAPSAVAPVQIFRVVTNMSFMPDEAPELGKVIVATSDLQAVDSDPFTSPVRHVAVWLNAGKTEHEARAAQPVLHATGGVVLPVRHLDVREDEGTVIGQWTAMEGLGRVDVFRVPIEIALEYKHYNAGERLPASAVTQGGFKDPDAQPGAEYEYRVFALATVAGDQEDFSPYVARAVRMAAVVRPVDDLVVQPHNGSDDVFDLTWTMPPQGRVDIYRNETPPASGIDVEIITQEALDRAGLVSDKLLRRPTDVVGDQGSMTEVPWPEGWSRAYFTPVTVLNDRMIRVGVSKVLVRSKPVSQVRLIERVDEQFLTFAWPDGVVLVKIYQGPAGTQLADPDAQPAIQELSEDEYEKFGGVHLRNALPREGCSVHVVATSYSRGSARYSAPVTVQYPGLARLSYDIVPVEQQPTGRMFGGGARASSNGRRVVIRSDTTVTNIPVVLVHHPSRLPLHPGDGHEVERRQMNFQADTEMVFMDQIDLHGKHGMVRVFVDVAPDMAHLVAVLDPEVSRLRCG